MRPWSKSAGTANAALACALALFALAAASLYALQARGFDRIEARARAAAEIAAAGRTMLDIPLAVLGILEFDDNVEAGRQAPVLFLDATRETRHALDAAARLAPDKATEIESFRRRLDDLIEKARAPLAIGNATAGLTGASELSPGDFAQLASGARLAAEPSVAFQVLSVDLARFGDALLINSMEASSGLERSCQTAMLLMAAAGLAAILAARVAGRRSLGHELMSRGEARRRLSAFGPVALDPPRGSPEDLAAAARAVSASQAAEPLAYLAESPAIARPGSLRDPQAWARAAAGPTRSGSTG